MKKMNMSNIKKSFDDFVQASINEKDACEQGVVVHKQSQIQAYYQNIQKRLKIRHISSNQKFEQILSPMKKLKSFISIKSFLSSLTQPQTFQPIQTIQQTIQSKRKLQYQGLRGGLYMQKVQEHLRNNNMRRGLDDGARKLLEQLEHQGKQETEFSTWMTKTLGNISMKHQTLIKPKQKQQKIQFLDNQQKYHFSIGSKAYSKENSTPSTKKQTAVQGQNQRNFKRVSTFLTQRLKKILTDKYVRNSSIKMSINARPSINSQKASGTVRTLPQKSSSTFRKTACHTASTNKRWKQNYATSIQLSRAQTSKTKVRRPFEDAWKNQVNNKMNGILQDVDQEFKRALQHKKQLKTLFNQTNTTNTQHN